MMRKTKDQKKICRAMLICDLQQMESLLERHLMDADLLYYSLQAEIPEWGVFKAHLAWLCSTPSSGYTLEFLLECAAGYLNNPQEHLRPTEPIEYLNVACMYIESMYNLVTYIKGLDCFRHFSSMEDLFPGWDAMYKAYRKAIYHLIAKADEGLAELWAGGCENVGQLQYLAQIISETEKFN